MAIKEKDIELLWGRAANRCSFPDCRTTLTQDTALSGGSYTVGHQAHIVADSKAGPRGQSTYSPEERDSYHNLILLCPTHHTHIDNDVDGYPTERLHQMKSQHELWVDETLSGPASVMQQADEIIYADLIDSAVEVGVLQGWTDWTSLAQEPYLKLKLDTAVKISRFNKKVFAAVWPGSNPESGRALKTFSWVMHDYRETLGQHAKIEEGSLVGEKFYQIEEWNPKRYELLSAQYDEWIEESERLLVEATKAANWLATVVRRDFNPLFFATHGKFMLDLGDILLGWNVVIFEYTDEEKKGLPYQMKPFKRLGE